MTLFELGVQNASRPDCAWLGRLDIDNDLVPVPGLDGCKIAFAALELSQLDLAGSRGVFRFIVTFAQERFFPLAALVPVEEVNTFQAGCDDLVVWVAVEIDHQKIVEGMQ